MVLEAVAWLAGGTVYRGETASLLCNISVRGGPPGLRLAASWWVERPEEGELSSGPAQLVGGVGQDGVAELGVRPGGGPVSVEEKEEDDREGGRRSKNRSERAGLYL